MKKNLCRMLAAMLAVILFVPCLASAVKFEDMELEKLLLWKYTFNTLKADSNGGTKISVGATNSKKGAVARVVSGDEAIDKLSLGITSCDERWSGLGCYYPQLVIQLSFKAYENNTTNFKYCITTDDSKTSLSGVGGQIIEVAYDEKGSYLADCNGDRITDMKPGEAYNAEITLYLHKAEYEIKINKDLVVRPKFRSSIHVVDGMKWLAESKDSSSYIAVDDFNLYGYTRKIPQKASFQEKGEMPEVELPGSAICKTLTLFCNKTNTGIEPTAKDGTYYIPFADALTALEIENEKVEGAVKFRLADGTERAVDATSTFKASIDGGAETEYTGEFYAADDGTLMASLKAMNIVCGLKVWLDEASNALVISTEKYLDNVLRVIGGKLWMNGEPYYEISFNKFDLLYQWQADGKYNNGVFSSGEYPSRAYTFKAAEEALKQLAENGFKTIRVFCSGVDVDADVAAMYWNVYDDMFDLCVKYGIQVVACLQLYPASFIRQVEAEDGYKYDEEGPYDFFALPESSSRAVMRDFLKAYVERYKDKKCILMWEVRNELNLETDLPSSSPNLSAIQLGNFYADVAETIHKYDPDRPVTSGDAILRSSQYHQLLGVLNGKEATDFTMDNDKERTDILQIINHGLDVVSVHAYDIGESEIYRNSETNKREYVTFDLLMKECDDIGKPLYIGECSGQVGVSGGKKYAHNDIRNIEGRTNYLDTIIDAGVQLTHWWTFHSDRGGSFKKDVDTFSVTIEKYPDFFNVVKQKNAEIKERYVVNAAAADNVVDWQADVLGTAEWEGKPVKAEHNVMLTLSEIEIKEPEDSNGALVWMIAASAAVVAAGAAAAIIISKKKKA